MGWGTPALGVVSYITGAKDRKKANQAANAYSDQLQSIETTYPQLPLQAKQGILGSWNDYAQQTGAAASEATALPFQLYGMYQGMKGNQAYTDYLKAMTKKTRGGTSGIAGSVGNFYPASYS